MAERLRAAPHLSTPYNLNQGEAWVNKKKTAAEKRERKVPFIKWTPINRDTDVCGLGKDGVARVGRWFLKGVVVCLVVRM